MTTQLAAIQPPPITEPISAQELTDRLRLACSHDIAAKWAVTPWVLVLLTMSDRLRIHLRLAQNLALPIPLLVQLANEPDVGLRRVVAQHRELPSELLVRFASDPDNQVRGATAANPSTPPDCLTVLAHDRATFVLGVALRNPSTPPETLAEFLEIMPCPDLAANPSTPSHVLGRLAMSSDTLVRRCAAWNPATPVVAKDILTHDSDEQVRQYANGVKRPSTALGQIPFPEDLVGALSDARAVEYVAAVLAKHTSVFSPTVVMVAETLAASWSGSLAQLLTVALATREER